VRFGAFWLPLAACVPSPPSPAHGPGRLSNKLREARLEIDRLGEENALLAELCGARLSQLDEGQMRLSNMLGDLRDLVVSDLNSAS
jgi:hypothetical protein